MSSRLLPWMVIGALLCQCCGSGEIPPKRKAKLVVTKRAAAPSKPRRAGGSGAGGDTDRRTPQETKTNGTGQGTVGDVVEKARKLSRLGFAAQALSLLEAEKGAARGRCDYWLARIEALLYMGRLDAALAQTVRAEPQCEGQHRADLLLWRAKSLGYASRWREVAPVARELVLMDRRNKEGWLWYLDALRHMRRLEELRQAIGEAEALFPGDAEIASRKVSYLFAAGMAQQGVELALALARDESAPGWIRAKWLDFMGRYYARHRMVGRALAVLRECRRRFKEYGCPGTELMIGPSTGRSGFTSVVRHPKRRRVSGYGTETLQK